MCVVYVFADWKNWRDWEAKWKELIKIANIKYDSKMMPR